MPDDVPCAVCTAPGTLQCSRCRSIRFCGPEHQGLLWSSHKLICKPNAPLVFADALVEESELKAYCAIPSASNLLEALDPGGRQRSELELRSIGPSLIRESLSQRPPPEATRFAQRLRSTNGTSYSEPPSAAFAYACVILNAGRSFTPTERNLPYEHRMMLLAESKLRLCGALDALNESVRNTIELQALVLGTLIAQDAEEELVTLAMERLARLAKLSGILDMEERTAAAVRVLKSRRAGGPGTWV